MTNLTELRDKLETWKPRASELYNLIQGSSKNQITDKQRQELALLREKASTDKGLTARQEVRLAELEKKANAQPELSAGAKTFLDLKFKEMLYDRRREVYTKYFDKGNEVEQSAIDLLNANANRLPELMEWDETIAQAVLKKCERRFENEFIQGAPDIVYPQPSNVIDLTEGRWKATIIDIKSSWDFQTFPLTDAKLSPFYEWQVKAYLWLVYEPETETEADFPPPLYTFDDLRGFVVFALIDTPEHLINDELRKWAWRNNVIDIPDEKEAEIRRLWTYGDVPAEFRLKAYPVNLTPADVELIKLMVGQARQYLVSKYDELLKI